MNIKRIFAVVTACLIIASFMTACGDDASTKGSSSASQTENISETTKVIKKTSDGGTIEEDPEKNLITRNKSGEILSVKDKDGKKLVVKEYLETHKYVIVDNSSGTSSSASSKSSKKTTKSTATKSSTKSSTKSDSTSKNNSKSSSTTSKKSDTSSSSGGSSSEPGTGIPKEVDNAEIDFKDLS